MFIFVYTCLYLFTLRLKSKMGRSQPKIVQPRNVYILPSNVNITVLGVKSSPRYMNILHRLESLREEIRKRLKGRRINRYMLYLMLEDIACRIVWNGLAFVIFTDFIDDIYGVVADIYRLCKVQKTMLVRYLAGYIGLDAVTRHVTGAGFRISALAH